MCSSDLDLQSFTKSSVEDYEGHPQLSGRTGAVVNTAAPMPFGRQFDPYPCQCGAFTVQPGDAVPRMMRSCGPAWRGHVAWPCGPPQRIPAPEKAAQAPEGLGPRGARAALRRGRYGRISMESQRQ